MKPVHPATTSPSHATPRWSAAALVAAAALFTVALVACNTVEGAGKDIEKGGQGIQNAAK